MPAPAFVDAVLDVVRRIPAGAVMTYGDIAQVLGSNSPRGVGRVLSEFGHAVPWWRVVPVSGHPPQGHATLALPHYVREGTPIVATSSDPGYRIRLSAARLTLDDPIWAGFAP